MTEDDEITRARVALGRQLALARRAAGLSQQDLGRRIDYSRSTVANVETGRQSVAQEFWDRCETVLGVDGLLLAAHHELEAVEQARREAAAQAAQAERQAHLQAWRESVGAQRSADLGAADAGLPAIAGSGLGPYTQLAVTLLGDAHTGGADPMQRRSLLFGLGGAATLGLAAPGLALEAARHGLMLSAAEEQAALAVEEWQEIVTDYGYTIMRMPPAELLDSLTVDLIGLQLALNRTSNQTTMHELRRVGALLAHLMALTVGGVGQLREAGRWWRTARRVADESGDRYTSMWIRGREVVRALYERRTLPVVLTLVEQAEHDGPRPPVTVRPELLAGKAQVLAMLGRSQEAEATLRELREVFADLPPEATRDTDSWFSWPENRLRFTESFVYSELGQFQQATEAQDRALALYEPTYIRGPAQIELQRARCLVGCGDTANGVRHAQDTISQLPSKHRALPIIELGRKVLAAVPVEDRRLPAVTEFAEYLALARDHMASR